MSEFSSLEFIEYKDGELGYDAALAMNGLLTAQNVTYAQMRAEIDSDHEVKKTIDPKVRRAFTQYQGVADMFLGYSEANETLAARQRRINAADDIGKFTELEVATNGSVDSILTDNQLEIRSENKRALDTSIELLIEPVVHAFRDKLPAAPPALTEKRKWGRRQKQEQPQPISFDVTTTGLPQTIHIQPSPERWGFSSISASFSTDRNSWETEELSTTLNNFSDGQHPETITMLWENRNDSWHQKAQHVLDTYGKDLDVLLTKSGYEEKNHRTTWVTFDINEHSLMIGTTRSLDDHDFRIYRYDAERNIFSGAMENGQKLPEVSVEEYLAAVRSALSIFPLIERPQADHINGGL